MKKTLVYGLHKDYEENKEWITAHFSIAGYFDQDESRLPSNGGIHKNELKERLAEFDYVLVTADPVSIVNDLMIEYDCPEEKIRILFYEQAKATEPLRTFHGEHYEDAALLLLCHELGFSIPNLHYVEIGTNDPVRFNQSYNLYRKGARGLLVDPLPSVGILCHMARPEDRFLQAAVSDKSRGTMAFFQSKSSTVSSLSADHHKEWDGLSHNEVHEIRVDVLCINDVLKCINTPPDLLLIDAEGEDERIVRSINYENFGPHILMIEMDHMTNSCLLIKFLQQKGYLEYATVANNKIFVKKETWETRDKKGNA